MSVEQQSIPPILYGTAWKEQDTQRLVFQALTLGFKGIDTANQRKHYFEEGTGEAIWQFLREKQGKRRDLFIQTKFTSANGQDSRKPYDEFDSLTNRVKQSFESSLTHLQTDYLDAYILHGPTLSQGLADEDLEIWQAMEALAQEGKVHYLGISNVTLEQLEKLYQVASIKPLFVQNRCFAINQWDKPIRLFCQRNNLIYQGFSLLTANHAYLLRDSIKGLVLKYNKTIPQIIFRFALQSGMLPLTGTTSEKHMKEDVDIFDFELSDAELLQIENIALEKPTL